MGCTKQQHLKYSTAFRLVSFIYWGSENIYWMNNSLNKIIETRFAIFSLIVLFICVFIHFCRQGKKYYKLCKRNFSPFCHKINPSIILQDLCIGTHEFITSPACHGDLYSKLYIYSSEDILKT